MAQRNMLDYLSSFHCPLHIFYGKKDPLSHVVNLCLLLAVLKRYQAPEKQRKYLPEVNMAMTMFESHFPFSNA